MLQVKNLKKSYKIDKKLTEEVLRGVDFTISEGEFVSIIGPSGSGKSTLINIISGLDNDYEGEVYYNGTSLKEIDKDLFHSDKVGFVFQSFHLIPQLSILENVMLALQLNINIDQNVRRERAEELLTKVGLGNFLNKKPTQLSGGQKQRVAIARALANNPQIIIADEPTGALDSQTSDEIIELLKNLTKEKRTVIVVTHDMNIADQSDYKISIKDGKIIEITRKEEKEVKEKIRNGTKDKKVKRQHFFLQSLKYAYKNFFTRFKRNLFVALGMSIGITAILIAMGLGNGVDKNITSMFQSQIAPTQITSFFISDRQGPMQRPTEILSQEEIDKLKKLFKSEGLTEIYENSILNGVNLRYKDSIVSEEATFTLQEANFKPERYSYLSINEGGLINGSMNEREDGIILPEHIASDLLKEEKLTLENTEKLIGKKIVIVYNQRESGKTVEYETKIAGITDSSIEGFGGNIFIFTKTMENILSEANLEPQVLSVEAFAETIEKAQEIIEKYEDDEAWSDYNIANANTFISTFQQYIQMIVVLISCVAGLSLIVSGVMIAIILYISVIERTKEIGLLRAIGYRKNYVQRLFILEATLTVAISNILSVILAQIIAILINPSLENRIGFSNPIVTQISDIGLTFAITIAIGIIFALSPSRRAAKLDPVIALRSE